MNARVIFSFPGLPSTQMSMSFVNNMTSSGICMITFTTANCSKFAILEPLGILYFNKCKEYVNAQVDESWCICKEHCFTPFQNISHDDLQYTSQSV